MTALSRRRSHILTTMSRWFDSWAGAEGIAKDEPQRVDWVRCLPFLGLHVACLAVIWVGWSPFALWFALALYVVRMFAITGFYHRYFSHKTFKTTRAFQFVIALWGNSAVQRGPLWWAAHHRLHHKRSDHEDDVHSPHHHSFWWSHIGWILTHIEQDRREIERKHAPELVADPVHRFLNRAHIFPNIIVGLALYAWGGWSLVVWGVFLRLVINLHATWFVNSAAHTWGYRTFDTPEGSTNLWWVGLVAWGEGWHNNHHAFQRSARHGHAWWEIDMTWMAIRTLMALGLATDVQGLPKSADQFRLDRKQPVVLVEEPAA